MAESSRAARARTRGALNHSPEEEIVEVLRIRSPSPPLPVLPSRDFKTSIKIEKLAVLEGFENYELWAQQLLMIFDALEGTHVVVDGYEPPPGASAAQLATHKHIATELLLLILQVVSQPVMLQIGRQRTAHNIWLYLRETYFKDSPLSFVNEIYAFNTVFTTLDPMQSISKFIDEFEIRWMRLHSYTSSARPGSFKAAYRTVLELEEAKREFLLAALVKYYPNVVDKLTTKADLTYRELNERLRGLPANNQLNGYNINDANGNNNTTTALVVHNHQNNNKKRKNNQQEQKPTTSGTTSDPNTCSYCKRYGGRFQGHR